MDRIAIENLPMPITYGRHLLRLFDSEQLLVGTGISQSEMEETGRIITVGQALIYVGNAISLAREKNWYLSWAASLTDHFHGPISLALMSAPNLGAGVDAFLKYFPSRIPYMHFGGQYTESHFRVVLSPLIDLGPSKPLLIETPMVILLQHLRTVYDVEFDDIEIELDYSQNLPETDYVKWLGDGIKFESPSCALRLPLDTRRRQNLGYSESSWNYAISQCEVTLASSIERNALSEIILYLHQCYADKNKTRPVPSLEKVSNHIHLSPRTVIRRLAKLGTNYQELTDQFLRARALELLDNQRLTIKRISEVLGFNDPANFGKKFKRWYGVSPGRYRKKILVKKV